MRVVTTAVLGIVVMVLAVTIALIDRAPRSGEQAAALANVLVRFDPKSANKLEIESNGTQVVLERQASNWYFVEPEVDRANTRNVAMLLDQLNHLSIVDTIGKEEDLGRRQIGVEGEKAVTVKVSGGGEGSDTEPYETSLILGLEAPRSNSIYAARSSSGDSFVVEGNPLILVRDALTALRDLRVLGAPVEGITRLALRKGASEIAFQREVMPQIQDWSLYHPVQSWADKETLDQFLADLAALEIEEISREEAKVEEIPRPLPDHAAVIQYLVVGHETPVTVFMKQVEAGTEENPEPLVEVRTSDRPGVYKLRTDFIEQIPTDANSMRDRTLARIPWEQLNSIMIHSRVDPLVDLRAERRGQGMRWRLNLNGNLVPANVGGIIALMEQVNARSIVNFVTDSATDMSAYGLVPPACRLIFNLSEPGGVGEDGSPLPPKSSNRILNLGSKEGEEHRLYANFEGEPYVYELDPTFLTQIQTHPVKWKSLDVLTFNPFHLRSITRQADVGENIKLAYDNLKNDWQATRNGVDVTDSLDKVSAQRLRDRLGAFSANGWLTMAATTAQAHAALQSWSTRITIVTKQLDPATNEPREVAYDLKFAPSNVTTSSGEPLYYGQLDNSPDVFIITHANFRSLMLPLTSSRLQQ